MSRVTVIAKLTAKPGQEERVRKELEHMVEETEKEPGCLNYDLHKKIDDPTTFVFHENWESKEALDKHMQTPHFLNLGKIASEILIEAPEVGLFEVIKFSNVKNEG